MLRNVLNTDRVLDGQAVRLGFETGFVDEDAGVGVEAGKGQGDVVVEDGDFGGRDAGVLEFEGGAFFAADYDDVFAFYADGAGSCFLSGVSGDGLGWGWWYLF